MFGVNINAIDVPKFISEILEDIKSEKQRCIVAINPEKLMIAREDVKLKSLLNSFDYKVPDGMGVVLASKIKKGCIKNRFTGIDCMDIICNQSRTINAKIFLYGAKPNVVNNAKIKLEAKYPGINIVGVLDGYQEDNDSIIDIINKSKADILFVALGSPKQEYWIENNKNKLNVKILQGVGGSFDVISGKVKRAPKWMQRIGLEWFYRLIKQPNRVWRQLAIVKFLYLVIVVKRH